MTAAPRRDRRRRDPTHLAGYTIYDAGHRVRLSPAPSIGLKGPPYARALLSSSALRDRLDAARHDEHGTRSRPRDACRHASEEHAPHRTVTA
jgi:hypothetical protein